MKRCTKCGEEKDESDFHKDKRVKCGLESRCKVCRNEMSKKWSTDNPHKAKSNCKKAYLARKQRETQVEIAARSEWDRAYRSRNPAKVKEWDRIKTERLSDALIKKRLGLNGYVPLELIELKRITIQIKRELKQQEAVR